MQILVGTVFLERAAAVNIVSDFDDRKIPRSGIMSSGAMKADEGDWDAFEQWLENLYKIWGEGVIAVAH